MNDERQQELERLEKELLKDIPADDDLLADIPRSLWENTPDVYEEEEEEEVSEPAFEDMDLDISLDFDMEETQEEPQEESMKEKMTKNIKKATKAREDKWLIVLMIIASFLSLGIIGVFIYWMEAFLK